MAATQGEVTKLANLTPDEKYQLITRNLEEIVGEDEIKKVIYENSELHILVSHKYLHTLGAKPYMGSKLGIHPDL